MTPDSHLLLHRSSLSLEHDQLTQVFAQTENLLIIQDLDGVCMGLVKDPLTRVIDPAYVKATQAFDQHFYVLTNGEHIGQRGVNGIIERAFGDPVQVKAQGLYLPGLAAGGVQWQDRHGNLDYPGVSEAELTFLSAVPDQIKQRIRAFFQREENPLDSATLEQCIEASALDNQASPTANLNTFFDRLHANHSALYRSLQVEMQALMMDLLQAAKAQGLEDSFFFHYAPNLGRDPQGQEIMWPGQGQESGTTDFQFMLRGAIKEAGVLAILNRYYYQRTGDYPLGADFNARQAPHSHEALLELVQSSFDPQHLPVMVGVGDTVTSHVLEQDGQLDVRRGGSDRNFLQLIQDIGHACGTGNIVVYVDSSGGEVKNRRPLQLDGEGDDLRVTAGPGDPRDQDDPLNLSVVFPGGHEQYRAFFKAAARDRQSHS